MVGLHYLKALYNESDESVVAKWVENPYWQYFCGEETLQHQLPCHPSSLGNWRRRVGVDGLEKLLSQVIKIAMQCEALSPQDVKQVIVDTTVQEKADSFAEPKAVRFRPMHGCMTKPDEHWCVWHDNIR